MKKKNLLIIVPARGGSTGLKNKNIKNLGGKPLFIIHLKPVKLLMKNQKN